MKTKIIIEDGQAKMILTPETDLEAEFVEKINDGNYEIGESYTTAKGGMIGKHDYKIILNIIQKK